MALHFLNDTVDTKIDASLKSEPTIEYQVRVFLFDIKLTRLGFENACCIAQQFLVLSLCASVERGSA